MKSALKYGMTLAMGVDHPAYGASVTLNEESRKALLSDLS
jgi:hypothetical protein